MIYIEIPQLLYPLQKKPDYYMIGTEKSQPKRGSYHDNK